MLSFLGGGGTDPVSLEVGESLRSVGSDPVSLEVRAFHEGGGSDPISSEVEEAGSNAPPA